MNAVASKVAFTVSGREVRWTDVIAHARRTGTWDPLRREVAQGLGLNVDAPADALAEAANAFRYARGLIAGDEMREWLTCWGLSIPAWRDHIRRTSLLAAHQPPQVDPPHEDDPGFAAALWASAVCSGTLEDAAAELAGLLAAGEWLTSQTGTTTPPCDVRAQLTTQLATDEAVASNVQARALDWIRIDSSVLTFDNSDAAREALSLLRLDGLRADEVAALAHAPYEQRSEHLVDVDEDRRAVLIGASEGDVLGPLPAKNGFQIVEVRSKRPPSPRDSHVRDLAIRSLVDRLIRREADERVVWGGGH
jgi:hypothetical protein